MCQPLLKRSFLFEYKYLHSCEWVGGRADGKEQVSSFLLMARLQWCDLVKDGNPWIDVSFLHIWYPATFAGQFRWSRWKLLRQHFNVLKLFLVGAVLPIRAHFFQPLQELRFNNSYRGSCFVFFMLLEAKGPRTFMTPMATILKLWPELFLSFSCSLTSEHYSQNAEVAFGIQCNSNCTLNSANCFHLGLR